MHRPEQLYGDLCPAVLRQPLGDACQGQRQENVAADLAGLLQSSLPLRPCLFVLARLVCQQSQMQTDAGRIPAVEERLGYWPRLPPETLGHGTVIQLARHGCQTVEGLHRREVGLKLPRKPQPDLEVSLR